MQGTAGTLIGDILERGIDYNRMRLLTLGTGTNRFRGAGASDKKSYKCMVYLRILLYTRSTRPGQLVINEFFTNLLGNVQYYVLLK